MSENQIKISEIRLENPICIGIGGVSRSGKTFLADLLRSSISDSIVIHQDMYIPDKSEIPRIKNHIDWERPEAIDWISFRSAIDSAIISGKTTIVEGLFAFQNPSIVEFYNKSIFIDLSKQEFIRRKRTDMRWGKEPEWYISHIWDGYMKYGQLHDHTPNPLLIDGEIHFDLHLILNYLKT
jgi:nicotinamide/nicotinate riboside kinase